MNTVDNSYYMKVDCSTMIDSIKKLSQEHAQMALSHAFNEAMEGVGRGDKAAGRVAELIADPNTTNDQRQIYFAQLIGIFQVVAANSSLAFKIADFVGEKKVAQAMEKHLTDAEEAIKKIAAKFDQVEYIK